MDNVKAYENLRGLVYTPFYVGIAEGLFEAAGIKLEATLSPSGEETAAGAASGRVDLAWGGPMRVMAAYDKDPEGADLVCFGLAVARDPFLVIAPTPNPSFTLAELLGRRLLVATHAPTPWMLLQEDVRRLGLDPAAISRQDGVEPSNAFRRLQSGDADYVLAFEPWGSLAELDSLGAVVSSGARRGPLAFTSFYANRTFIETRSESVTRLTDGLGRALDLVRETDPAKLAAIIKPWFPDFGEPLLATAIARYQRLNLWPSDPAMTADGYTRLKSSLLSSGYISSDPAFEKVCL